jgi:VanZ family protein
VLFAGLGITASFRLAAAQPSRLTPTWLVTAALLIVIFATAGELAQFQVVGRSAALGDWVVCERA